MAAEMMKVAYHVVDGAKTMYAVDANAAVAQHPLEWSWRPFHAAERDAHLAKVQANHKKAVEEAKAAGLPPPTPPVIPPVIVPTPAEKSELDADAKARAAAAELVRVADEKAHKEKEEADKIAAAKALLSSPPPVIDPTVRRPVGRPPGPVTAAERAAAEKAAAKPPAPPEPAPIPLKPTQK